jgi:hypothetical protein
MENQNLENFISSLRSLRRQLTTSKDIDSFKPNLEKLKSMLIEFNGSSISQRSVLINEEITIILSILLIDIDNGCSLLSKSNEIFDFLFLFLNPLERLFVLLNEGYFANLFGTETTQTDKNSKTELEIKNENDNIQSTISLIKTQTEEKKKKKKWKC